MALQEEECLLRLCLSAKSFKPKWHCVGGHLTGGGGGRVLRLGAALGAAAAGGGFGRIGGFCVPGKFCEEAFLAAR